MCTSGLCYSKIAIVNLLHVCGHCMCLYVHVHVHVYICCLETFKGTNVQPNRWKGLNGGHTCMYIYRYMYMHTCTYMYICIYEWRSSPTVLSFGEACVMKWLMNCLAPEAQVHVHIHI